MNSASWRIIYDPRYINRIELYFSKLQQMKHLMDNARQAAQESSLQIQQNAGKFYFKVDIKTPIVEVPNGIGPKVDRLVFYLGRITAESSTHNSELGENPLIRDRYSINVSNLKLESVFESPTGSQCLNMIEDIDLKLQMDIMIPLPDMPSTLVYFKLIRLLQNCQMSISKLRIINTGWRWSFCSC